MPHGAYEIYPKAYEIYPNTHGVVSILKQIMYIASLIQYHHRNCPLIHVMPCIIAQQRTWRALLAL